MVQPYDYIIDTPDPTAKLMEGFGIGRGLRAQEEQRQQQLAQQERAAAFQAELAQLSDNPNSQEIGKFMLRNLDYAEKLKAPFEIFSKAEQRAHAEQLSAIDSALQSGNMEVTKGLIDQYAEAARNAGEAKKAKTFEDAGKLIDLHPGAAKKIIGVLTSLAVGPEKYAEIGEERRKEELHPLAIEAKRRDGVPTSIQETIDYGNLNPEQQKTFQALQVLKKPPAAVTNVNVTNLEKTASEELAKLLPDLYDQANSSATLLADIPRYRKALETAITGPFAEERLTAARIANFLGLTGDKGINATQELVQGNAEMALKSRGMMKGQGQITEGEQKLLMKARSGDINFTKGELSTLFSVFERAAKSQHDKSRSLLQSAAGRSETARMFLDNVLTIDDMGTPGTGDSQSPGAVRITLPNGQTASFQNQQAADAFRRAAGLQ